MSEAVKRRVAIYEQEGKVEPEPRPDRINPVIRSIQIKRAEEIRKASAASRTTEGGMVKRESNESFQAGGGYEMPTVKLDYPHSVLESVARMAAKEANLQKEPMSMMMAGKRSYDHMSHSLGLGLSMGNTASYQAHLLRTEKERERKAGTGDTDPLIDNRVLEEAAKNPSVSIFFHNDPTKLSPLQAPSSSSSSAPPPPLPGHTFKNTFGFLDVLAAAASEVSEKEIKREGSPRLDQELY